MKLLNQVFKNETTHTNIRSILTPQSEIVTRRGGNCLIAVQFAIYSMLGIVLLMVAVKTKYIYREEHLCLCGQRDVALLLSSSIKYDM